MSWVSMTLPQIAIMPFKMHSKTIALAMAAASSVAAQRPTDTPICDYYTTALLKENTAENQYTLLTLLVNTVVIGNYTEPNTGVAVPGILAKGDFMGTSVNLLPYFNGDLASTNRGGDKGESVNFLDGGGAAPLMENKPANSEKSRQHFLLTHLYQFFGSLLGCSKYSMPGFPAYGGDASMYEVHKFMDLDPSEMGYFIQQVALAAESFGVAKDDITAVGKALTDLFNFKCLPAAEVIPGQGKQLQSICIAEDCPEAKDAQCDLYKGAVAPEPAHGGSNATMTSSTPTSGATGQPTTVPTDIPGGAASNSISLIALAGAFVAFMI
ncbi:hypothetical protein D7B24_008561 [Verticillium nonalfalfae]|nr:uncharacterized protein D7B24_008561 [Verticillium nonalfalfae]RNJ55423.1 hypothetical protein D7B24_008561 [Verticillium nonalfalfae]